MTEITINFTYIFAVIYMVFKAAASIWICKREFQYPIWNRGGVQIERGLHHKVQSFMRNWAINPEWGALKAVAFAPVFLVTGKRHIHAFMPWHIQKVPPFCQQCNDKGRHYVNSFFAGEGGWQDCECRNSNPEIPEQKPNCTCHVCLDKRSIGKNRPCPHCERRLILARHGQTTTTNRNPVIVAVDVQPDFMKTPICEKCNKAFVRPPDTTWKWCSECYKNYFYETTVQAVSGLLGDPYRYLKGKPCFCGDPHLGCSVSLWHSRSWLRKKQPTELQVGDTIVMRSVNHGHRAHHHLGENLRILGLNLPFAVVEYDTKDATLPNRMINTIDLRGMTIYGQREKEKSGAPAQKYQPLLDPAALKLGDKFVVLNIRDGGTDGSFRGKAFRVTKISYRATKDRDAVARIGVSDGALVIEAKHLSFHQFGSPTVLKCESLHIIPVNDQYINATQTHCPDLI